MDRERSDAETDDAVLNRLWLRAGVIYPIALVAPWVILALVLAHLPGSELDDIAWTFLAVFAGSLASVVATIVMAIRRTRTLGVRVFLIVTSLATSALACVAGFYGWLIAAETACHGGYECPF